MPIWVVMRILLILLVCYKLFTRTYHQGRDLALKLGDEPAIVESTDWTMSCWLRSWFLALGGCHR